MKKEYIKPETLVMCVETITPIAASTSDDFTVIEIENGGSDYDGKFYSPSRPNSLWIDDEE